VEEETSSGGKSGMEMKERIRVRKQGNTVRVQLKEISQRPCWRERERGDKWFDKGASIILAKTRLNKRAIN